MHLQSTHDNVHTQTVDNLAVATTVIEENTSIVYKNEAGKDIFLKTTHTILVRSGFKSVAFVSTTNMTVMLKDIHFGMISHLSSQSCRKVIVLLSGTSRQAKNCFLGVCHSLYVQVQSRVANTCATRASSKPCAPARCRSDCRRSPIFRI